MSGYPVELPEEALLKKSEFPGDDDADPDNQIPAAGALKDRHPLAGKFEDISILSPWRNRQIDVSPERRNGNLCAQGRLGHTDRELAEKIVAVPLKQGMAFNCNFYVEIAGRSSPSTGLSRAGKKEMGTAPDPRRYFQRNRGGGLNFSTAVTAATRGFQALALTLTLRTGDGKPEQVAAMGECTAAMTDGACDPAGTRLCA